MGFIHPRWLFGISSINNIERYFVGTIQSRGQHCPPVCPQVDWFPSNLYKSESGPGDRGAGLVNDSWAKYIMQGFFWAIYSDLSRRVVTPNGGGCKGIPPKWPKHSGEGLKINCPGICKNSTLYRQIITEPE